MTPLMHPYVVVPILACTLSAATALTVWMRDPGNGRVWPIGGVSACGAIWAFCEIAWHVARTPDEAVHWMRLSAFGWVPLGPVAFHALMVARDRDSPLVRAWLGVLYAGVPPLLVVALGTPWTIPEAFMAWWGWTPIPGPGMALQYTITGGSAAAGLLLGWRRGVLSEEERWRLSAVRVAIGVPMVVASVSDIVLPFLGITAVPRIGTLSLAVIGGVHVWSFVHYGDSILVPEG